MNKALSIYLILFVFLFSMFSCLTFEPAQGPATDFVIKSAARRLGGHIAEKYPQHVNSATVLAEVVLMQDDTGIDAAFKRLTKYLVVRYEDDALMRADLNDLIDMVRIQGEIQIDFPKVRMAIAAFLEGLKD